ncbi:MAG: chorismate synthase, partial [Rhodoluna sp.]|nr:chorismate synthase [Rhodoluna sp.]
MLRWLTAGESHGPELVAIVEGMPAGVTLTTAEVQDALARRRLGFGRGARMKFEKDVVSLSGGVRHGLTMGGPVAITVQNSEWPKWQEVMSADPLDAPIEGARGEKLTRPRPGHADFTGMQKYGFDEARPVLERASARETAARVALGAVAASFLKSLGIELVTHTVAIGTVFAPAEATLPRPRDVDAID